MEQPYEGRPRGQSSYRAKVLAKVSEEPATEPEVAQRLAASQHPASLGSRRATVGSQPAASPVAKAGRGSGALPQHHGTC